MTLGKKLMLAFFYQNVITQSLSGNDTRPLLPSLKSMQSLRNLDDR